MEFTTRKSDFRLRYLSLTNLKFVLLSFLDNIKSATSRYDFISIVFFFKISSRFLNINTIKCKTFNFVSVVI